jgi:uncharacterized protein (DUF2141 family)
MKHKDTETGTFKVLPRLIFLALGILSITAGRTDEDIQTQATGTLEVRITGFESAEGKLAIALFANDDDYSTQSNAIRRAYLPISNMESQWAISDLPEGSYALIAYHDENDNGQIDMRVFGMPKEPVGVSNDARGVFGPPRFKAAKFEFLAPLTRHEIKLR